MTGQVHSRRFVRKTACIAVMAVSHGAFGQATSAALKQADAAYRAGQAALSKHDLTAAQTDFEQVVRLAPSAEQGHSALGAVLVSRGRTKEGIRELEAALALKKTDTTAQMNLAIAYQQIGQPAKAIPLFTALEAGKHALPAYALASYSRSLAATQKLPQAAEQMKAAVQAAPKNPELHDELGSIYAQQEHWHDAQHQFEAALQLNPALAMAHLHLGLAMQAQGQPNVAKELTQAQQLAPDNPAIRIEVGKALAAVGQDEEAISLFWQVLQQQPESTEAKYELALALQRSNKVQDAIALLRSVVAAEPRNADALTNLGMALTQVQQAKDAVPVLQRSTTLAPQSVTAHQDLAAAYVQLSQFADAIRELHTALKLSPDTSQLHYDLGLALKMQDDAADAIPELEAAEKLDPTAPEAPYVLGVLYMQTGRYEEAAREIKTSLNLRPENGAGWATLGSVYSKLNLLPEATSALREAIKQLPEQPDPHLTLAGVLAKQNQAAEATAERKKAADLMRTKMNRQRAEVATNAGKSLLKNGDLEGATVQFRDALSYDANYAEAHLGLAMVLDRQGKTVDAAAERQKADAGTKTVNPQ